MSLANGLFRSVPPDTGSSRGDLEIWVEQTVDDFSSAALCMLFRERLANKKMAEVAAGYIYMNLLYLCDRCERRGEVAPNPDRLIDLIFAARISDVLRTSIGSQVISDGLVLSPRTEDSVHDEPRYPRPAKAGKPTRPGTHQGH